VTKKPDIVVVGGGPCGSYSALTAAKLGAEVTVCEEHEIIGAPKHCSGHLNIASLNRLGLQTPQNAIENEIRGAVFHSPSGKEFVLRRHNPITYVVNRELFDKHLADVATKSGVNYLLLSRVKSLLYDSGFAKGVSIEKNGNKESVKADIVVDAEGCSSALLKKAGLRGLKGSMVVRGIQAEVDRIEGVCEDMVEMYFGRKVAPGFFAWIIPTKGTSAKVGLATESGDPRKYLQKFMEKHPVASEKLKNSRVTGLSLHPIPVKGPLPKTYSDGFLVVGDAASQVKPTTGGGVIFGLTCSKVAGEVAYEAVKRRDFSESFLSSYQSRWKKLVGFELAAQLRLRRALNSLSDEQTDRLIDLARRLGIDSVLEKVGDLDFQGKSLVPMLRYPGMLVVLLYFMFSWLTSSGRN
jgi:digeranylgeranylglycerophospholipid reductase